MSVWVGCFALLIVLFLYFHFTPKDVDPEFINSQSSISSTRNAGETAVYRSHVNDHGRMLLGGGTPINSFKLADIWSEIQSCKIMYCNKVGTISQYTDLKPLVAKVQRALEQYPEHCEIPISFGVSVEALISLFAIVLSGRIPRIHMAHIRMDGHHHEEEDNTIILKESEFKFDTGSSGINFKTPEGKWIHIPLFFGKGETASEVVVKDTVDDVALKMSDMSISQVDLGVSIAGNITSLGIQHRWSAKDMVFMSPALLTPYSIVAILSAISLKSTLLFAETSPTLSASNILEIAKPTVLVTDDVTMSSLAKQTDLFRVNEWITYAIHRLKLAKGKLLTNAMVPGFETVRLIHTATGPDPYKWLSNGDMACLRVLTGTQVVHVYTPDQGLPVTQTVIGDYRSAKRLPGVLMGAPLPGLEIKKRGDQLLVLRANHSDFQVLDPSDSEHAKLGSDGCLYIPEKRKDFSEYYYYTGELK